MTNKLTIKVTKMAFYNGALVYPNEIIKNYKGDSVPSWATLANGKEAPVKKDETEEVDTEGDKADEVPADDTAKEGAVTEQTEEALMEEYNALLDEAVEKNILLEDADKKTIVEQIAELKTLLKNR